MESSSGFVSSLIRGICDEVLTAGGASQDILDTLVFRECETAADPSNIHLWHKTWSLFSTAIRRLTSCNNAQASIASEYESMPEFWSALSAQELGERGDTIWDSYEHGKRRSLETEISTTYGGVPVVLMTTGMSGILASLAVAQGDEPATVVTCSSLYFETADLFKKMAARGWIKVARTNGPLQSEVSLVQSADVIFLETVMNSPSLECAPPLEQVAELAKPSALIVIDNTCQGVLTDWHSKYSQFSDRLVVIESAAKYLTNDIMGGTLTAQPRIADAVRDWARSAGQLLPSSGLHWLSRTQIKLLRVKMGIHSRNTHLFASILATRTSRASISTLADGCQPSSQWMFRNGIGCLVFVKLGHAPPHVYDAVISKWRSGVSPPPPVRAGFGWHLTCARAYAGQRLNQMDAPNYLRISVGLEPEDHITRLAHELGEAINHVNQ